MYKQVYIKFKTGDMEIYTTVRHITLVDDLLYITYEHKLAIKQNKIPVDELSSIEVKIKQ